MSVDVYLYNGIMGRVLVRIRQAFGCRLAVRLGFALDLRFELRLISGLDMRCDPHDVENVSLC